MSRKLILSLSFLALICGAWITVLDKEKTKPNVLVIIIDDLGFHDLSLYGSKIYETPNVDRLASESYSFSNAYANYPRCLPSRYAMITSSYPLKEFNGNLAETKDEGNFIKQFKKAGYDSYFVGKWHQKGEENSPVGFGFDDSFAANSAGGVASHFYPYNTRKITAPMGEVAPVEDIEKEGKEGDYLADALTDKMISYVKTYDKSKPFFAILSTYAVHSPFEAKQEDIGRNEKQIQQFDFGNTPEYIKEGNGLRKMRQDNPIYAAMVENMDWNVGRLLNSLKDASIDKNTIVVFTSDHGGLSNNGSLGMKVATTNFPLRAGKGHLYEGGTRVPLLIRWPEKIKPRADKSSIVLLMDLMPSLLDLAADKQLKGVDGRSFENVINGKEKWDDRTVFYHEKMARPNTTGDFPCTAMRSGNYKLLHYLNTDSYELYDLTQDVSEERNIFELMPDVADKMKSELSAWKATHLTPENND
ncbi:MAG: sulfatase [Cyclobacteriaceae bacterium]